jgi:hypothetical protein
MPILERILSSPFSAPERKRFTASAGDGRGSAGSLRPRGLSARAKASRTAASASQGCTASAP